ncbi:MAG: type II toxin-antitoxin system Phd/YefM family antitoxin [Deltaproteobacteria bacterium]|nr:type II toxin-antitoxin system Phd/YefM family antitoxin [Deltaproteobacteria bacterium]MBW1951260.1 type II toxin-antitoxin system Phd/YefM family antitoxin [Deltaproteobacteria bacterium]RLB37729.1 MAG: type II toxin-antitoxin system Phd/YefM family antitoxin [Deltaproteobacteria bacterium]
MAGISLTALRARLFKAVDEVIRTGIPLEIERKGHRLKIVLVERGKKLENLKPHDCIVGDPDELVDLKVGAWQGERNL